MAEEGRPHFAKAEFPVVAFNESPVKRGQRKRESVRGTPTVFD
jgi:hypothetical protein